MPTKWFISALLALSLGSGCGLSGNTKSSNKIKTIIGSEELRLSRELMGTKIIFHSSYFYDFAHLNPSSRCAGDIRTYFYPMQISNTASTPLPMSQFDSSSTIKPSFIKNISVDLSNPGTLSIPNLGGSPVCAAPTGPLLTCINGNQPIEKTCSKCALFANSGYYSLQDSECTGLGVFQSEDPAISKLRVGGLYIDINRNELNLGENLLLHLTYLTPEVPLLGSTSPVIEVHLLQTGENSDELRQDSQPRHLIYASEARYPMILRSLAKLPASAGMPRQEQILVPLGNYPTADRIRIERFSGSAIFIEAMVLRLGR